MSKVNTWIKQDKTTGSELVKLLSGRATTMVEVANQWLSIVRLLVTLAKRHPELTDLDVRLSTYDYMGLATTSNRSPVESYTDITTGKVVSTKSPSDSRPLASQNAKAKYVQQSLSRLTKKYGKSLKGFANLVPEEVTKRSTSPKKRATAAVVDPWSSLPNDVRKQIMDLCYTYIKAPELQEQIASKISELHKQFGRVPTKGRKRKTTSRRKPASK